MTSRSSAGPASAEVGGGDDGGDVGGGGDGTVTRAPPSYSTPHKYLLFCPPISQLLLALSTKGLELSMQLSELFVN